MTAKDLFAVAIGAMAVWFISLWALFVGAMVTGPFAHLIVGTLLLAVAGFVARSGPILK